MKSEIVILELKVKVSYDNAKARKEALRCLPKEVFLDIASFGMDGCYTLKSQSAEIQK